MQGQEHCPRLQLSGKLAQQLVPKRPTGTNAPALPSLITPLSSTHADYPVLSAIAHELLTAAGGPVLLQSIMGEIVRDCIDRVIQTPKSGRRFYTDLQNSEKTYIGTAVEVDLRSALGLKHGPTMDLEIAGYDVDVKFTHDASWMIPPEARNKPLLLITVNDKSAIFSFGLVVAKEAYLNLGLNRDAKTTIKAEHRGNIYWFAKDASYPKNFWLTVTSEVIQKVSAGRDGNTRMITLFREVQDRPIPRKVIEDVAKQVDPTRRVRADKARGTRNVLELDGIYVFSGGSPLLKELGLPATGRSEWIAHKVKDSEKSIFKKYGLKV